VKPAPFSYAAPREVDEALSLLQQFGYDGKVLAGGQSLVPMMALRLARFDHIIDINNVSALSGISRDNGHVVVGAMTRQADVLRDPTVAEHTPLITEATHHIGHFQIRNRGTLGGSIAHADPTAEYPAVAVALDAQMEVSNASSGTRTIAADDFFDSSWATVMEPEDLLTAVRFPVKGANTVYAIDEVARRAGDFALVGGIANLEIQGGTIGAARVVLFGVDEKPTRMTQVEAALTGASVDGLALADIARDGTQDLDPPTDVQATGEYRKKAAPAVLQSVIEKALARASKG
jgi:carbon-monoxide dehydrogenase medium subunit